jgi:GntR family transcriptional regulator / MocR family aminotransferase
MDLALDGKGFLYEQIARALKVAILEGRLTAGSRLPSTRLLSRTLQVSRKSVLEAYDLLCAEQLAVALVGSGTRVADFNSRLISPTRAARVKPPSKFVTRMRNLPPIALAGYVRPEAQFKYDLVYGEPIIRPALLNSWRRKMSAASLRAGPFYPTAGGYLPLRRAISDHLARRHVVICDPANVLIVGGTQQALSLVARVLLDEGDIAVVEDPCYQMAMQCLSSHGAQLVRVSTDAQGLEVRKLPSRATKLVHVTPSHQFPGGSVMSLARKMELLHWARKTGAWIFEDNYDAEFHSGGRPDPALCTLDLAEQTIYAGSFSKTLFPSLRLGYIVCPVGLRNDLFKAKLLDDLGSPTIEQAALATFIHSRQYERHLRKSIDELTRRRRALHVSFKQLLGSEVDIGPCRRGMHAIVWLKNLSYEQLDLLVKQAASAGLGIYPVHPYFEARPSRPGLLIGYAGISAGQIGTAAEILARCIKKVRK